MLGVALAVGLGGRIDRTDRQLGAVRAHLHQTLARAHQAEHDLASVSGQSASVGQALASETSQLDSAQAQLASTESNVHANGVSINELVTCLAGVERALNQISLSDQRGAAASLDSVAAALGGGTLIVTVVPADPPRDARIWRRGVGALAVLALLAAAVVGYDVAALVSQHQRERDLAGARLTLQRAQASLATTQDRIAAATATRDDRTAARARTEGELDATDQNLDGKTRPRFYQGLNIGTLNSCLGGVAQAVTDIGASDLNAGVAAIDSASPSCLALDGTGTASGLVYPYDFPDPFILPVGDTYYGYATNSAAGNIQIIRSTDLTHWTTVAVRFPRSRSGPRPPARGPPGLRRGSPSFSYSAVYTPTGEQCISAAVATQPQGPFVDSPPSR